jgi:hypothetical protein
MKLLVKTALTVLALAGTMSAAQAGGRYEGIRFSCESGRSTTLQPHAVTEVGEVVTGRLYTGPRRGAKLRLIPMGNGYRYAGRGIWLDGIRSDAELHLGKHASTPCTRTS